MKNTSRFFLAFAVLILLLLGSVIAFILLNRSTELRQQASTGPLVDLQAGAKGKGYTDAVSCGSVGGWSCDSSLYSQPTKVTIYYDSFDNNHILGTVDATANRPDIVSLCGGTANHGFTFPIPAGALPAGTHTFIVRAWGLDGQHQPSNALMYDLPAATNISKTVTCAATAPATLGQTQATGNANISGVVPPASQRTVAPNGAVLLNNGVGLTNGAAMNAGNFQVEGYCPLKGLGHDSQNSTTWFCGSTALQVNNFDQICQLTYKNTGAFAIADGTSATPAFNWRCYAFPGGVVQPGTGALQSCGQPCGLTIGFCQAGTECTYLGGPTCATNAQTYCIPDNAPAGWSRPYCVSRDTGNSYVLNANGQTPSIAEIQQACLPPVAPPVTCQKVAFRDELSNSAGSYTLTHPQSTFMPGDNIVFQLFPQISSGTSTATFVDQLDPNLQYVDSNCGANAYDPTTRTVTCPNVATNTTRGIRVKVLATTPNNTTITNTINGQGSASATTCNAIVTVQTSPTPTAPPTVIPTSSTFSISDLNKNGKADVDDYRLFLEDYRLQLSKQ